MICVDVGRMHDLFGREGACMISVDIGRMHDLCGREGACMICVDERVGPASVRDLECEGDGTGRDR